MNNPLNIAPRSFNRVEVDERRGTLTKTSSHKEKLRDEIRWYLKIPKQLQCFAPRVFSYSPDSDSPSMTLEFYSYRSLHEYFMTAWGGGNENLTCAEIFGKLQESKPPLKLCALIKLCGD